MATPDAPHVPLSPRDPFQQIWDNPDLRPAVFRDDDLGFMVIPDGMPVVENHLVVVGRDEIPYDKLPDDRRFALHALVDVTVGHVRETFPHAERLPGVFRWGNQIKTPHMHVVPRLSAHHGLDWSPPLAPATPEQIAATSDRLNFDNVPGRREQAAERIRDVLRRFA